MTRARAAVVVVHYGDAAPTRFCVRSVLDDPSEVERAVAVVDNQGNLEPEELPDDVVIVRRPDNPGFGTAVNEGAGALDSDRTATLYVALNNDAALSSGFLAAAVTALEPGVGAAGGPILDAADGRLWYAGGGINFLTGTVRQQRSAAAAAQRRDVGFIPATAIAVSARAWREVGGFDPRFFLYNEDLDLCLRLRRAGWRLRFEPSMVCEHRLGGTTGSASRSPLYLEHITRTRLLPFRSRAYRLYLGAAHSLYNAARVAVLAVRNGSDARARIQAVVHGHCAALRSIWDRDVGRRSP